MIEYVPVLSWILKVLLNLFETWFNSSGFDFRKMCYVIKNLYIED